MLGLIYRGIVPLSFATLFVSFLGFMNIKEKKEIARHLFTTGMPPSEVATRLSMPLGKVEKWASDEQWENMRKGILSAQQHQLVLLYGILAKETESKAPNMLTIERATTSIERLEKKTSISAMVSVGQDFINFLTKTDRKIAKEILPIFDAFILDRFQQNNAV